jgi:nucleotide-binding universal stress UspA family protein
MRRIIVGVDESYGAAAALRWAVDEAEFDGAELTAVLAWDWLDQHHRQGVAFDPSYGEAEARQAVAACVQSALGERGDHVATQVVCDLPAPALLAASAEADLLVVGARGTGGFTGLLLGSVAQQCLHHSSRPIAIIGPGAWPRAEEPRIAAAVDGSDTARRALCWAVDEARRRSAVLDVVNVWHLPFLGYSPYGRLTIGVDDYEQESPQILRDTIAAVDTTGLTVNPISRRSATVTGILEVAAGADLLVAGSRGRGAFERSLFGSVATQLSHHAPGPLVVVPPDPAED